MKRIGKYILIVFLFFNAYLALADDKFHLEIQTGDRAIFGISEGSNTSYPEKWSAGIGGAYDVSDIFELNGSFSYHSLEFSFDLGEAALNYRSVVVSGHPAQLYELSVGIRLIAPVRFILQPYMALRVGHDIQTTDDATYTFFEQNGSSFQSTTYGRTTGNTFAAIGIGINIPFNQDYRLKVECFLSSGGSNYAGYMAAFQFSL